LTIGRYIGAMVLSPQSNLHLWQLFTRLGEAQILLPLALAGMLWLFVVGEQRAMVLRWGSALAAATLLTLASKVAFFGWGIGSAEWDFTCFSGHAMFSAAVLPVLCWVVGLRLGRAGQQMLLLLGLLLAGAIGYSRLEVHAHSVSEVVSGFVLGASVSAFALYGVDSVRKGPPLYVPLGLLICLAFSPTHAPAARAHDWVLQLSVKLSGRVPLYTRQELHRRARLAQPLVWRQCDGLHEVACNQS